MAKTAVSLKRIAVSKANTQIVTVAAIAAFTTVFCLVASNYLLGLRGYQSKILSADQHADLQLRKDVAFKRQLVSSYSSFVNQNPTILGVNNSTNPYQYNNSTIILDALPSQYDFPALTSTIAKILQSNNFHISAIGGTDESATMAGNTALSVPKPVPIPFTFSVSNASYQSIQVLFTQLQRSIRPIQIDNLNLTGTDTSMSLTISAHTFYQPGKVFKIGTETIAR